MDGDIIDSKAYAARLGVGYPVFRQALSYRRALEEGRDPPAAVDRPVVRRTSARIAPGAGRVGRSPVWSLRAVEAFELENPQALRDAGRDRGLDPELSAASPAELRRAAGRAELTDRERRVLLARYGVPARGRRRAEAPTLEELGRDLGVTRQRAKSLQDSAERKVRGFLG